MHLPSKTCRPLSHCRTSSNGAFRLVHVHPEQWLASCCEPHAFGCSSSHLRQPKRTCKARAGAPQTQGVSTAPSAAAAAAVTDDVTQPQDDVAAAWSYLKELTLKSFRGLATPYTATAEKRGQLRQALQLAYSHPWPPAGWVPPRIIPAEGRSSTSQTSGAPQQPPSPASPATQPSQPPSPAGTSTGSERNQAAELSTEGDGIAAPAALVMIGLMASDVKMGARAMRDYCAALGLPYNMPESRVPGVTRVASIEGTVYMKYNSMSQVCYVSPYLGKERGVLLQLGQEQLGHFPLGLWDEDMKAPPPAL